MSDHTNDERVRRDEQCSAALDARLADPAASWPSGANADPASEARVVAMLAAREALRDDGDALPASTLDAMVRSAVRAVSDPVDDQVPVAPPRRAGRPAGPRWLVAAAAVVVIVAGLGVWATRQEGGSTESAEAPTSTALAPTTPAEAEAQDRSVAVPDVAGTDPVAAGEADADAVPAGPGPAGPTTSTTAALAPSPEAGGDDAPPDGSGALTAEAEDTRALGLSVRDGAAAIARQFG